jgi:hypothetical protein
VEAWEMVMMLTILILHHGLRINLRISLRIHTTCLVRHVLGEDLVEMICYFVIGTIGR